MKKITEAYACDKCGKIWLNKDDLYQCIHCGKDICNGINCSYNISVTVYHDIPNGIPFLRTQARYVICHDCHELNQPLCKELHGLIMPKENSKFYRHGSRGEKEWERVI